VTQRVAKTCSRAVTIFRQLDDPWGLAFSLLSLGGALLLHHKYADAVPYLEESVRLARAMKADIFLSNALINLGLVHPSARRSGIGSWTVARIG
jgi:hypothetical protein